MVSDQFLFFVFPKKEENHFYDSTHLEVDKYDFPVVEVAGSLIFIRFNTNH